MEIIIGIIVVFVIYWIFKKFKNSRGLIGAMVYNEDLGLKPYSQYDMQLSKQIREMGGKIYMSEIIVFKWYLIRSILGVLGTEDIYKLKSSELSQQLDMTLLNGFGTELNRFTQEELEMRLRGFYFENIPLFIEPEYLVNMSDEEIYESVFQDEEVIENVGYLFLNGDIGEGLINPLFQIHISEYLRRNIYMQRILLKNILLNPSMLTM